MSPHLQQASATLDNRRNGELDFWKFIVSWFILLVHSYTFFDKKFLIAPHGYLAVEFFFIVTGFLFASSVFRDKRSFDPDTIGTETWCFIGRKIRGFLDIYLFGFILTFLAKICQTKGMSLRPDHLPGTLFDLLLMRETGIPFYDILGPNWYLSAMIVTLFVLYPILRWHKNLVADWVAPILALGGMGYLYAHFGNINPGTSKFIGIMTGNMLRSFAEIALGIVAYRISERIRACSLTRCTATWLAVLENLAILVACVSMGGCMRTPHNSAFIILCFFIFVCIAGSQIAPTNRLYNPKWCTYLGRLSMALYLMHTVVRRGLPAASRHVDFLHSLFAARDAKSIFLTIVLYLSLSLALSIFALFICDHIKGRNLQSA